MITLRNGTRLWRVKDVRAVSITLHRREIIPGALRLDALMAGHDHLGLTVNGENHSAPGESTFLHLGQIAKVTALTADQIAAFDAELSELYLFPDQISGTGRSINTRERAMRRPLMRESELPPAVALDADGKPVELDPLPETSFRWGEEDRAVQLISLAPPASHGPSDDERRAELLAERIRIDAELAKLGAGSTP